ncbi:hypothetical protein ACWKWU_22290 [Chitinophaga lutea]
MMLHCNTVRHPMAHIGTRQRDRLLTTLIPGELRLDERTIGELIAFAGKLSGHVRHWGPENTESGDWVPFWESDLTSLLAIIASTDLDSPRTEFRSREMLYRRLKKREDAGTSKPGEQPSSAVMEAMIKDTGFGIYGLALTILRICQKTPASHPLKQEIAHIISGTLQDPLYRLIQFHKAVDPNALQQYEGFIGQETCAAPWGLPDKAAFECIDFILPYEYIDQLWALFLQFYKALSLILAKAGKAFQSALRTRRDHEPHVALFIAFLYLFRHLQDELNSMVEKHLMFYYHDVLRLQERRLIPDKVHVVFELAAKLMRHRLTRGTGLKAGADANGKPMFYTLTDELVISKAKLVERRNLYVRELPRVAGEPAKTVSYSLPAADMRDGLEEEWAGDSKAWSAFSGEPVYQRLAYQYIQLEKMVNHHDGRPKAVQLVQESIQKKLEKLNAFSGFSISTPELWQEKGVDRLISLRFKMRSSGARKLLDDFDVELSTEKGLIRLRTDTTAVVPDDGGGIVNTGLMSELSARVARDYYDEVRDAVKAGIPPDETFRSYNRVVQLLADDDDADVQHLVVWMHPSFPAVRPLDAQTPPFIRFRTKDTSMLDTAISNVQVYTFSGNLRSVPDGDNTDDAAVLADLDQDGQLGAFYRVTENGVENKDVLVLLSDTQNPQVHEIFIRVDELFFKYPEYFRLEVWGGFGQKTPSFLYENKWIDFGNYTLDIDVYSDRQGPLAAPPAFPFDQENLLTTGWVRYRLQTYQNPNYVLDAKNVQFSYRTQPVLIYLDGVDGRRLESRHFFSNFNSLGEWAGASDGKYGLSATPAVRMPEMREPITDATFEWNRPRRPLANGNLFLGFEDLQPDQTLSLLVKTAPGTGNPDHYAPAIEWSYLADNNWYTLPPQYILKDTTLGMQQTGILLLQIPSDINNGNTAVRGKEGRTDLFWLRASAIEIAADNILVDALPMLKDIHVNAAEAVFAADGNTEDHLEAGIPAGTISALRFRDTNVKAVAQPYTSFDGRRSEAADKPGYIRRIHERLRHKDRAVSTWDYERLLLEAFPQASVVKCLPHSRRVQTVRPGHVTVAAIPFPDKMTGNRIYYPIFDAGDLTRMKQFLAKRNSYFVGGYGDPGFCCCDDGCRCDSGHDRLDVINARFEPVRIKICVRFQEGRDIPYYTKALNEALKSFLAPWAKSGKPISFGMAISRTSLLQFLENLDYVDVVTGLEVKHFHARKMAEEMPDTVAWSQAEDIVPYTAASVLTTYLDRLNEDNPNVIDHEIHIIRDHDRCACGDCDGEQNEIAPVQPEPAPQPAEPAQPVQPDAAVLNRVKEMLVKAWGQRRTQASIVKAVQESMAKVMEEGLIQGEPPSTPEKAVASKHAYKIVPVIKDDAVVALKVGLALTPGKFTNIQIDKP